MTNLEIIQILFLLVGLYLAASRFIHSIYNYWKIHGVPQITPIIPYGNIKGVMETIQVGILMQNFYISMLGKGPFVGIYFLFQRAALAVDLEFVKKVLIKDFHCFENRGIYYNERDDPLSTHLFAIESEPWRKLRSKLTPTFTSGKMKFMYPSIIDIADRLENTLSIMIHGTDEALEIKELLGRFATDIIGNCAFGIECNSLSDPNCQFLRMGRRAIGEFNYSPLLIFLIGYFPNLSRFLRIKMMPHGVEKFFLKIVKDTVEHRKKNNIHRSDFMDIMIQLTNQEKIDGDATSGPLTLNEIAAQAFLFFLGGFDSSSTTMSFCLYELAANPIIQQKVRDEVNSVLEKHNGHFTYEAMMDMTYIDQAINETLRKYPPMPVLMRRANCDYKVPEYNCVIPKGTPVWIPVYGIHHNPEYYPNPYVFDPEHFSANIVKERNPLTFLAFGEGPRNCIGLRFGLMQVKVGLVTLLKKFEFSICSKTIYPVELDEREFVILPKGGIWLNVRKIK